MTTIRRGDEFAQVSQSWGNENQKWIGGGGKDAKVFRRSIILDRSAFDLAGTFTGGFIPSGVCLGIITATGLYAPYVDANSDGTQTAVGFLLTTVAYNRDAASTADIPATLMRSGVVITTFLPTGHGLDAAGKTDLAGRFDFVTRV